MTDLAHDSKLAPPETFIYTFRQLANAIHKSGAADSYPERNRDLNRLSER